ncbi:uncharacterized protein LOC105914224 [Setaria italica]|uniref:uncharacterized protein LOC105914224 n=1 Tax=Setaria italica TaxID=4555 RepID=UPI0006473D56|nr:uncharacterized protein LOC105914224 [Setaria italica]
MIDDDQIAQDLWLTIEGLFHANKQSWATFLSHDFHSMTQGNSSITVHCQRMKTLADALRDVGHPIQDSQLVLNLLRGLNPRFSNTIEDIANSTAGFPSFDQARDMLTLKELHLANEEKISNSTAGFLSFAQAHDMLTLKELRLANEEKISNSTTLLARNSSSSSSFDYMGRCRPPSSSIQTGGSSGSSSSNGHGGKKKWQKKGSDGF